MPAPSAPCLLPRLRACPLGSVPAPSAPCLPLDVNLGPEGKLRASPLNFPPVETERRLCLLSVFSFPHLRLILVHPLVLYNCLAGECKLADPACAIWSALDGCQSGDNGIQWKRDVWMRKRRDSSFVRFLDYHCCSRLSRDRRSFFTGHYYKNGEKEFILQWLL
jgi:hypothetical protein